MIGVPQQKKNVITSTQTENYKIEYNGNERLIKKQRMYQNDEITFT